MITQDVGLGEDLAEMTALIRSRPLLVGLWLDTSHRTITETVNEILARAWAEARFPEFDQTAPLSAAAMP